MKKAYQWTVAFIVLGFVAAGIFLTIAPDQIPAHYNFQGEVDRWGSKYEFLIMPVFNVFFGLFMALVARFEGQNGRDMNERIVGIVNNMVLLMFNLMWIGFMWKAVDVHNSAGELGDVFTKSISMLLMASFIPMGNILPKVRRNSIFGLRTKWSMANDHCWQQSQRIGGFIMVVTGILGVILTAALPALWGGYAMLALIVAMTIACIWVSYRVYMRSQVQ